MKHTLLIMVMLICSMRLCLASEAQKTTGGFWNNSTTNSEEIPVGTGGVMAIPLPGDNPGRDRENSSTPVGEGIFFMLALAGGYGLQRFKSLHDSKKQSSTNF